MNYNYLQQGGLTSLPTRPVLAGQQHELSYITPEEARMLRQQGGGVTPTGGQYTGPGGVPAFIGGHPGHSGSHAPNTASSVSVGSGTGHGGPAAGPGSEAGSTSPGGVGDPEGPTGGYSPISPGFRSAYKSDEARKKAETIKARLAIQQLTLNNEDGRINPASYQAMLDDPLAAFEPSFFSREGLFGLVENALSHGLTDITTHGDMDSTFGHVTALSPAQAAAEAMGLEVPADKRANIGDAYSGFGRAIIGLTDILGLVAPPIGLFGDILSLGRLAGIVDLPQIGDLGLHSLIGDMIGDISTGDDGSTVSSDLGDFGDRFAESTGLQSLFDYSRSLVDQADRAVSDVWSGSDLQSATQSVGEAFGQAGEAFGEAFGEVGEAVGEGISSIDLPNIDLSLPNIDLSLPNLGDWSGDPSLSTDVPQGGGPGIAMPSPEPVEPTPPYESPTFRNYPDTDDSQGSYLDQTSFFQPGLTLDQILSRYIGSPSGDQQKLQNLGQPETGWQTPGTPYMPGPQVPNTVTAQEGGGIQGLINNQNKEYSIRNQSNVSSFNKATPHPDLTSGSHGYISNILKGHTVPMGMTNVQQMQKPIEAFPTGGQMNTTNTQYADYSKPQSFYAMPNMNRIT